MSDALPIYWCALPAPRMTARGSLAPTALRHPLSSQPARIRRAAAHARALQRAGTLARRLGALAGQPGQSAGGLAGGDATLLRDGRHRAEPGLCSLQHRQTDVAVAIARLVEELRVAIARGACSAAGASGAAGPGALRRRHLRVLADGALPALAAPGGSATRLRPRRAQHRVPDPPAHGGIGERPFAAALQQHEPHQAAPRGAAGLALLRRLHRHFRAR